jgi:hypothetical protein
MAFQPVQRIRIVVLIVRACPESGSGDVRLAAAHELTGNTVLVVPM